MPESLIIYLADKHQPVSWASYDEKGELIAQLTSGLLSDAAEHVKKQRVSIVVPGTHVTLLNVDVPARNLKQAMSAIPYAVEEHLAADIDDLHFAISATPVKNNYTVAVTSKQDMQQWLTRIADAGITVHNLFPETLLLPVQENKWFLMRLNGTSLLRTDNSQAIAQDNDNAAFVIDKMLLQAEVAPESIQIMNYSSEISDLQLNTDIPVTEIEKGNNDQGILRLFEGLKSGNIINLLQGGFKQSISMKKTWKPWVPVLIVLFLWAGLETGLKIWQKMQLEQQSKQYQTEIKTIYTNLFPEAKNIPIGRERTRIERLLSDQSSDSNENVYLKLLSISGSIIHATHGVIIRGLNYRKNTLQLSLEVPTLEILDGLKQKIFAQGNVQVEIQGVTSQDGKVKARLKIQGLSL